MKSHLYKIFIIISVVISSCTDQLDILPSDQISSATFWKSKGDFDKALTAAYATMQSYEFSHEQPVWDCLTDNAYAQHNSGSAKEIVAGSISPSTGGYVAGVYNDSYKGIATINIFLKQLEDYKGSDMPDAVKKQYTAEVKFLRAFYYFQLYYLYGDVPLVLEPLTVETQIQPKVPAPQVLTAVLADVDFAIANLTDVPYFQNSGHAVVTSAKALKARVLILAAYGNTGTPDIEILKQVRDLTVQIQQEYTLSPKFEDLYRSAGQKGNQEIIFSVNYLAPNNTAPWDMYYGDWLVVSPLQNFVNDFECTDGLPYGTSPLTNTTAPFENRDSRLAKSVFVDHPDFGGGKIQIPSNSRPTGFGIMKYLDPANLPFGFSTLSAQNAVIFRLGEVLLMYAEAQNEISGPDATVYQAMTTLRGRVGMPAYPAGLTKEAMRLRIRHERRIELAFEGLRYFDLKRWRIAKEVMNNVKDGLLPYHFEDKLYKWPLPQTEIDKSKGILIQNPDYK